MIPVVTIDKEGNLAHQVFNDNLTVVEQIDRLVLGATAYAQKNLVNVKTQFDTNVEKVSYTAEQLDKIKSVALKLDAAVKAAVVEFENAIIDPDSVEIE